MNKNLMRLLLFSMVLGLSNIQAEKTNFVETVTKELKKKNIELDSQDATDKFYIYTLKLLDTDPVEMKVEKHGQKDINAAIQRAETNTEHLLKTLMDHYKVCNAKTEMNCERIKWMGYYLAEAFIKSPVNSEKNLHIVSDDLGIFKLSKKPTLQSIMQAFKALK